MLGLALGLVLGMAVGYSTPVRGQPVTNATLNVHYPNSAGQIAADVRLAMRRASVVRLQEVETPSAMAGVRRALAASPSWRSTRRQAGELRIIWDARVWQSARRAKALLIHHGVAGLTPDRWLLWKALRLRSTGAVVVVADVHAVSGYCTGRSQQALRQQFARDYWATVARWTRRQLRAFPSRPILLGGDLNCWLSGTLPGRTLRPLYRLDRPGGFDHLLVARTPGRPTVLRRWQAPINSDHDLHLQRLDVRTGSTW